MAVGNRTEVKAQVDSDLVATVTLTGKLNPFLKNEFIESAVFRKDIIASETPAAGNVTIDYKDKDTATVTTAVNLAVSFTNLENGDVKFLSITKAATNTITFAGAIDVSTRKYYINSLATLAVYRVSNKNGVIYVESINIDNDVSANTIHKLMNTGVWNMEFSVSGTSSLSIVHGITGGLTKIKSISVKIFNDGGTLAFDFIAPYTISANQYGGLIRWSDTTVTLLQNLNDGSYFDDNDFDSGVINRGELTIHYTP